MIVSAITTMAHGLFLPVIAENMETATQHLASCCCPSWRWFYFEHLLAAEAITQLLSADKLHAID